MPICSKILAFQQLRPRDLSGLVRAAILAIAVTSYAGPAAAQETTRAVRVDNVRAALSVLAADSLEGRATGTEGGRKAAEFIAAGDGTPRAAPRRR